MPLKQNVIKAYNPMYQVLALTPSGLLDITKQVVNIETRTSVRGIGGQFRIKLVPSGTNLYDVLEPMTYVEVRLRRDKDSSVFNKWDNSAITTVMRGFITAITKDYNWGSGQPQRIIDIQGENYGKILRQSYIHYNTPADAMQDMAAASTAIPLYAKFAIDLVTGNHVPSNVFQQFWDMMIYPQFSIIKKTIINRAGMISKPNPDKEQFAAKETAKMGEFKIDIDKDGVNGTRFLNINYQLIDPNAGLAEQSFLELLDGLYGKPWNEFFIDDAPDASYLVYRPVPWRDRNGEFIGASEFRGSSGQENWSRSKGDMLLYPYPLPTIEWEDLVQYSMGRSDADTFNYFITYPQCEPVAGNTEAFLRCSRNNVNPRIAFDWDNVVSPKTGEKQDLMLNISPEMKKDPRINYNRMELYGFRKLQQTCKWTSRTEADVTNMEDYKKMFGNDSGWLRAGEELNTVLYEGLEHSSQLESGVIVCKGREDIRPGMFIQMKDERSDTEYHTYYVTDVAHNFVPFQYFISQITVARGEGHLNHVKQNKDLVW